MGVAAALGLGALLVSSTRLSDTAVSLITAAGILAVVAASIVAGALAAARR